MLGCREWVKTKALELVRFARMHETHLGCGCPWCEHAIPSSELLSALIEHVAEEHGQVASGTLGDGLTITMADGRVGKVRDVTDVQH